VLAVPAAGQTVDQLLKTPEQLLQKIDQIRAPGEAFVFDVKLTAYKGAEVTSVNGFTVHVKDSSKSLVKFTAPPASKGRALLMSGDNLWIYIPGSRGALRISPQQRLLGQIAYGDVARVVYNLDYQVEQVEEETLEGTRALRLDLKAKSRGAAHDRIRLWVARQTLRPIKAEFLALSGKLLKVGYYKGYRQVLDEERPMILEVHDAIRKGEYSVLEYAEMRREDTPEIFFQRTYLEHVR
jgi:outer membrane lipoprotein-sorting protein